MIVVCKCPICNKTYSVEIPENSFNKWNYEGEMIQKAWPEGSAEDREHLISGLCTECQKEVFNVKE